MGVWYGALRLEQQHAVLAQGNQQAPRMPEFEQPVAGFEHGHRRAPGYGIGGGNPAATNASARLGLMAVAPLPGERSMRMRIDGQDFAVDPRGVADVVGQRLREKALAVIGDDDAVEAGDRARPGGRWRAASAAA